MCIYIQMIGLILTILVIIIILISVIYYISKRNSKINDEQVNSLTKYNDLKKNTFGHITNSLKEIDYLSGPSKSVGGVCYKSKNTTQADCKCHDSCSSCGYSNKPIGINQCLTCKNGTKVNSLYDNGAGWCGSFNEKGEIISSQSIDSTFSNNAAASVASTTTATATTATTATAEMTCNERFARLCSSSSNWVECLEKNKQSLVLAGCNITLEDNDSSASGSSASGSSTSGSSTSGTGTSGTGTSGTGTVGMIKKPFLEAGDSGLEKMLDNEYLVSPNSKFEFSIKKNGKISIKDNTTGRETWHASPTLSNASPTLSKFNGPYYLHFKPSFNLILYNKNNDEVWKAVPSKSFSEGTKNSKVLLTDTGYLQILDGGNIKWDSSDAVNAPPIASTAASTATVVAASKTRTEHSVFGHAAHQICPDGKFIVDNDNNSKDIACSTDINIPINHTNSCALKGYYNKDNKLIELPRCYDVEIAEKKVNDVTLLYTCKDNSKVGIMNNYIMKPGPVCDGPYDENKKQWKSNRDSDKGIKIYSS